MYTTLDIYLFIANHEINSRSRSGHDRMVVGFTTTYAIRAYHHYSGFEIRSWRGALDVTLCDKVCQRHIGGFQRVLFPPPIKLTTI